MAVILAARRTAVVPKGGGFVRLSLEALAVPVVRACLADAGIDAVDEVICANAIGPGGNPARRIALAAGLPERVAGLTIDRQCAGGLDALLLAAALVDAGRADFVLAGGVESFSRRPLRFLTDPEGGEPVAYDEAPFTPWPARNPRMADAAAALALACGYTRAAQEAWAVASHTKALAQEKWPEIVPVAGLQRDAFTRKLTPALLRRAPVVAGTITRATAAVAADGAAFCLVAADRFAVSGALHIIGGRTLGADPEQPGLAPVPAIAAGLAQAGLGADDIAHAEVMEAYAAQAMACVEAADLDPALVNCQGGALARGHPIGASGAVLAVRLFHSLGVGPGLAAIASAGGLGTALIVQR
ncbi:MAG: thiolase family protein [Pseudotabrizicola sp.]|uniref:thiolase family protein n=1 Tax=Pseudotabrizicola sp. TaxID=2939647 RepID=UPI0027318D32|nr:thiolase family protein [Pseudotabrizicola sp.]MDP2080059.1 thiolase family protein [Pseudotabrizicola sp.]MDZ7575505.1 thiolase family protein [Pseudotabrizicola sp.]